MPAMSASHPQFRPITSTTNARLCEEAVLDIASRASHMRSKAVEEPIVKSVLVKSLSIEPTRPTMCNWQNKCACSAEIRSWSMSDSSKEGHSCRRMSAPVKLPSPPQITSEEIPWLMRLYAAFRRPSLCKNSLQRADPIKVPPWFSHPRTSSQPTWMMYWLW